MEPVSTKPAQKATFKKNQYKGIELSSLVEMDIHKVVKLLNSRQRRRYSRGIQRKYEGLLKKLRKAKAEAQPGERPKGIKTHLRNAIIIPEMVGSVVEVYRGNSFVPVEIKADFKFI